MPGASADSISAPLSAAPRRRATTSTSGSSGTAPSVTRSNGRPAAAAVRATPAGGKPGGLAPRARMPESRPAAGHLSPRKVPMSLPALRRARLLRLRAPRRPAARPARRRAGGRRHLPGARLRRLERQPLVVGLRRHRRSSPTDASCLADPVRGMKVRNSLRGAGQVPVLAPSGATGGLQAVSPPGTVFTGLHADATAYDEKGSSGVDGWRAGHPRERPDDVWCAFQQACSWIGPPTLRDRPADLRLERPARGDLRAQHRLPARPRARRDDAAQRHARRARRRRPRSWRSGAATCGAAAPGCTATASLGIDATDNAGVRLLAIEAGGLAVGSNGAACD